MYYPGPPSQPISFQIMMLNFSSRTYSLHYIPTVTALIWVLYKTGPSNIP